MKKICIAIELLLVLLFVGIGCFRNQEIMVETRGMTLTESSTLAECSVTPGVYRVLVEAQIPEGGNIEFHIVPASETKFRGLLSNAVNMRAGQQEMSFEFYVTASHEKVQLNGGIQEGTPAAEIGSIKIVKTNLGFFMLAVLTLMVSVGINLFLNFYKLVREKKISAVDQVVVWVLLGCVLLASSPLLSDAMGIKGDTPFHLMRIEGLKHSLMQLNQFPIRVQSYWMFDHGYQVSSFYGDLFLLPAAFLRICGFSMMETYRMFVVGLQISTAIITYFCFKKCVEHSYGALFGTVLYMLAPYRIYNFYNRGAIGECMGMTFFPLVICGIYLLLCKEEQEEKYPSYKYYLVAGFTCLLQSHLISTAIAAICVMLVCVICWRKTFRKKTIVQLLQGVGITLLINAWFWVPILHTMVQGGYHFTSITAMDLQIRGTEMAGIFQLVPYMGGFQTGMFNCEPIQIGAAGLLLVICFLATWKSRKNEDATVTCLVLLAGIVVTLFMSTRYFPWDALLQVPVLGRVLGSIQIPTRMVAASSVLCAFFGAIFVLREKEAKNRRWLTVFFSIIALATAIFHVNDITYNTPATYLHTAENLGTTAVFNGEYLLEGTKVSDYYYHEPVASEGVTWSEYEKQGTRIEIQVANEGEEEGWLELPLIAYPGYRVKVLPGGEGDAEALPAETVFYGAQPIISETYGAHGDLRLCVPAAFSGKLEITYGGLVLSRIAELVSLLGIVGLVVVKCMRKRRTHGADC